MSKMEQLLDLLVNEEMEKAHELFHEIVVEKSRGIYENLIAEEAEEEEVEESDEEESEDEQVEEETTFEIGGDAADDLGGDIGGDDGMGDLGAEPEMGGDDEFGGDDLGGDAGGTEEERIEDLEDALEELKAEFEKLMAGEKNEPEHDDMFGGDDEGGEEGDEEEEDGEEEDEMMGMESTQVREYVEKVGNDWEKNSMKTPGPIGSGRGDLAGQATETGTKSVGLQNPKGRPTTTASAHNLLNGGTGVGEMSGTSPNADKGSRGLVGATKGEFTDGVTVNKNGSTTGIKKLTKVTGGHGAEKKGQTSEFQGVGANTGGPAGQTGSGNTRSPADRRQ
jgi:hypothetical protein